jgi:hypothetical protein
VDLGIGSYVTMQKGVTQVTGLVDGLKVNEEGLERISLMELDHWFYMSQGWQFLVESEDDDAEIQPE